MKSKIIQIKEQAELIGKTIAEVLTTDSQFWVKFTDNSFAVFDIEDRTSGFEHRKTATVLSDWDESYSSSELVALGIITKKEQEKALKEEQIEWELRLKKSEEERLNRQKAEELELLEKLHNKYGETKFGVQNDNK